MTYAVLLTDGRTLDVPAAGFEIGPSHVWFYQLDEDGYRTNVGAIHRESVVGVAPLEA